MRTEPINLQAESGMNTHTLESVIQDELELVAAIRQTSNRLTLPVILALVKTLALPLLVFTLLGMGGVFVREYVETSFQDSFLNFTTTLSSYFVLLGATWYVFRWSDRRFGGVTLLRGLGSVLGQVARLETALERARASGSADPATTEELSRMAYAAWEQYTHVMQAAGFPVDPGTPPTN
jgi:hypothetical protein